MDITAFIDTFGNLGVIGLIGYMIFKGELITRHSHTEIVSLYKAEINSLKERLGDE